jgi:hypothetical protein
MRKAIGAVALAWSLGAGTSVAAPMTALDRQRLVAHLEATASWFLDEVSRLSPAQIAFRPTPESWTILERN